MNLNKRLYLNDTVGSERYIASTFRSGTPSFNQLDIVNENSSNGRIRLMIDTEENVIIENSQLYSKRVITAVAGVKGNTYNSNGDNDVLFQRDDVPFMTLDKFTEDVNGTPTEMEAIICSKQLRANANILVRNLQINQISVGVEYADFRLHNADSVMRFYAGNSTGVNLQITNNDIYLNRATTISSVKTNLINSNGDNTINLQQNGNTFISLQGSTLNRVQVNRLLRVVDGGGSTQCQFVESTNGDYMEFRLGNRINAYLSGASNGNTLYLNYNSHGNIFLGTDQDTTLDPIPTITINKVSSNTGNAFEVQGDSLFYGDISTNATENYVYTNNLRHNTGTNLNIWTLDTMKFFSNAVNQMEIKQTQIDFNDDLVVASGKTIQCNTINSNGNTDLVFERNGIEYFRLDDLTGTDILNVANDKGVSASYLYGNSYNNRSWSADTVFYGSNTAGTARVEYMRWNYASQKLDFSANLDASSHSITAFDLIEISDKRLKDNIEDVDDECSEIIKKVNVKTFNFKSDDKKKNHIGFIAQELKEILPDKFEAVVNKDGDYMGINYGKVSAILWKALQEEMTKTAYLESKLFETIARVEALEKPKKRTTTKTTT